MAKQIDSLEIFPGKNGGHRVVHNFKREAGKKEGAMAGCVYLERPKPAERLFGASEHGNVSAAMDKPTLLLDWGPAAEAGTSRPGL